MKPTKTVLIEKWNYGQHQSAQRLIADEFSEEKASLSRWLTFPLSRSALSQASTFVINFGSHAIKSALSYWVKTSAVARHSLESRCVCKSTSTSLVTINLHGR
ncbi:hypothetical protein [Nitrosomonas sp. PLL12-2]|uniref:hypothetical protein n=1 Tax=Nitrosomonas sp. PLL12-2 TaxID=2980404 RepID=UPI0021CB080E|nr:hypothetical protein [Nitrosomonas sp. PLL12-2]